MSCSSTPSNLAHLFNSAFKREDIRNKLVSASHSRSFSCNSKSKHDKTYSIDSSQLDFLNKTSETSLIVNEISSKYQAKEDFEYNNEMKYLDMAKRLERMQDFYKTQVARLTEEVSHYKNLYHKLLVQQSSGRKIARQ